ncbi:LAME_0C00694g1_1 [Lachancea meyersii CBS 8951]|uniref:Multifunctional tryptophan biosynthesis protein n=1 Tax=Lachancea meyersii CBS 8951 TaxID=1266667 RepID=A0A1G4IZ01_9SACH|nr:LAME_0C00694g1_1 [Lachancea meyersii CBS 8951]
MRVSTKRKVVLIDNYDSFTWNIYEYLCREGADVQVFRNDKITLEEVIALEPEILLISPGPGHPKTDSGVSRECIRHFAGKIPVTGVCMGQQCMFEVFGGNVAYAGEIVHGKTSQIEHDNKGIFKNVPQGVSLTRYHSLAGEQSTLPDVLEVTARTESGVIMGVRHKKYTVEGVQFHPESILSESGRTMFRNILSIQGGTWEEHDKLSKAKVDKGTSILDKIYAQRQEDVSELSSTPGFTLRDLQHNFDLGLAPSVSNFHDRLLSGSHNAAVIAEIKRASPSKGDIDVGAIAAEQGVKYARAGAAAISVLTEPHWFKGSIQDLMNVRKALDNEYKDNSANRPCVLRKEFIFSKYQILEARLAGADTVLLIVKMLSQSLLRELYDYSRNEMGMEPLVEVSSKDEMERALDLGAKIIGVNNRDLHSFNVDLNTTSSLAASVPTGTVLLALSGITCGADAKNYKSEGVRGLLVGEALMRASNVETLMKELLA